MKKLIAGFMTALITLLTVVSPVLAALPQPISGHIYTTAPGMAEPLTVVARNVRTGRELQASKVGNAFLAELANLPLEYVGGDQIKLYIPECMDDPLCVKYIILPDSPAPLTVNFDLTGVDLPCPVDTTPYSECDSCCPNLVCPTTTTCPEYDECPDCPEFNNLTTILVALFAALGGGFVMYVKGGKIKLIKDKIEEFAKYIPPGCGFKFWKGYNNKLYFTHLHRSPKIWHSQPDRHKEKYDHGGEENLFPDFS